MAAIYLTSAIVSRAPGSSAWIVSLVTTAVTMICLFLFAKVSILAVVAAAAATLVVGLVASALLGRRLRERDGG
jgi:uncharacterized membrane protein YjjB (DUF3815 family)